MCAEEITMPTRKHLEPDEKVGLKLTAMERDLLLDAACIWSQSTNESFKIRPLTSPFGLPSTIGQPSYAAS